MITNEREYIITDDAIIDSKTQWINYQSSVLPREKKLIDNDSISLTTFNESSYILYS